MLWQLKWFSKNGKEQKLQKLQGVRKPSSINRGCSYFGQFFRPPQKSIRHSYMHRLATDTPPYIFKSFQLSLLWTQYLPKFADSGHLLFATFRTVQFPGNRTWFSFRNRGSDTPLVSDDRESDTKGVSDPQFRDGMQALVIGHSNYQLSEAITKLLDTFFVLQDNL